MAALAQGVIPAGRIEFECEDSEELRLMTVFIDQITATAAHPSGFDSRRDDDDEKRENVGSSEMIEFSY
ncbi:MAG TPA: hypothetical protein VGO47_05390 [Chlamydiales bacterium]|nr:hypothetical protein [Chlamydiales bacterium]